MQVYCFHELYIRRCCGLSRKNHARFLGPLAGGATTLAAHGGHALTRRMALRRACVNLRRKRGATY